MMNAKLKEFYRKLFRCFPSYLIWKRKVNKQINKEEFMNGIKSIISNVPFYYQYQDFVNNGIKFEKFPIIRKADVLGHENEMVSNRVCKKQLRTVETGGSTGCSLTLYRHWKDNLKELVFVDYAFSFIGKHLILGVLRGNKPKKGVYEYISKDKIILSSYELCYDNLDYYLDVLNEYKISCLHAYPSSLIILAKLIKRKYGKANLPFLKGILTSSEIFSKEDKLFVRDVFEDVTLVDFYGHNEMACCAYSVNDGYYHFIPSYGYVEFFDTGDKVNGHSIAEIVATSIMNTTMPFIRYATDDYVELDSKGNVVSIIGRTSDFLVNCQNELTPCIVLTRSESFQNVTNFQYYQDTVGKMIFRVVVTEKFGDKDMSSLMEDLETSFNGTIECSIEIVPYIERTRSGKQLRLIQKLNINDYK